MYAPANHCAHEVYITLSTQDHTHANTHTQGLTACKANSAPFPSCMQNILRGQTHECRLKSSFRSPASESRSVWGFVSHCNVTTHWEPARGVQVCLLHCASLCRSQGISTWPHVQPCDITWLKSSHFNCFSVLLMWVKEWNSCLWGRWLQLCNSPVSVVLKKTLFLLCVWKNWYTLLYLPAVLPICRKVLRILCGLQKEGYLLFSGRLLS